MPSETKKAAPARYPTEELLASKKIREMAGYQPDFARVLLPNPEYTLQDAMDTLGKFFKGGGR